MLASAAPLDLSAWKYRKKIRLTPGDGLAVVKLDREVYMGAAPGLSDIRVIRDGAEVPSEVGTLQQRGDDDIRRPEKILDLSVVGGSNLQFTVHVPFGQKDRIRLYVREQNFRQRVSVEGSTDNVHWAMLRSDGAIFDFTKDGRQFSSLEVAFPVSTKPFLRVTIFGWNKVASVAEAYVDHELRWPETREILATIAPIVAEDSETKTTVATMDLGVAGLPIDRILLTVESPQFQRAASVEGSSNGKDWLNLAEGVIARLPGADFSEESLALAVPETRLQHLRVRIYNRDDQPLRMGTMQLQGLVRHARFLASMAGNYWLYYGDNGVAAPQYDLPAVLARRKNTEVNWILGPAEANPAYHPPPEPKKPWSEQHPAILYTVLGAAVLALGIATLRFMARLRTPA